MSKPTQKRAILRAAFSPWAMLFMCGAVHAQSNTLSSDASYSYGGGRYQSSPTATLVNGSIDSAEAISGTVAEASAFLDRSSSFGGWRSFNEPVEGTIGAMAGTGVWLPNSRIESNQVQAWQRPDNFIGLRVGPFYVDQISAGAGVIYSDFQGLPPGLQTDNAGKDNWGAVGWLTARFTAYVTDRFALSIQPFVYWLPLEGEVGWSAGAGYLAMNGAVSPQALLSTAFHIPVGTWNFSVYDQFHALMFQHTILNESVILNARAWDMSPMDRVGRYQFGGFSPALVDANGDTDLALSDRMFSKDNLFFRNTFGASLTGKPADNLSASVFYSRSDIWDNDFRHISAWNTAGAMLVADGERFRPYAGYFASTQDNYETLYQWAFAGTSFRLSPDFVGYAQAGYLWSDGVNGPGQQDSWLGQLGLRQRLGAYTLHGIEVGRGVTDPEFGQRYLADYATYYIHQTLGPRINATLFAQLARMEKLGAAARPGDRTAAAVGLLGTYTASAKSNINAYVGFERLDMEDQQRGWDMWTYRLSYMRSIGQTAWAQLLYQYQQAGSGVTVFDDFTEHLIYAGIMKRF